MVRELAKQSEGPRFESRHMGMDICVFCMFVCLSVFVCSEYTATYVLVKSVESKVPNKRGLLARKSEGPGFESRHIGTHIFDV